MNAFENGFQGTRRGSRLYANMAATKLLTDAKLKPISNLSLRLVKVTLRIRNVDACADKLRSTHTVAYIAWRSRHRIYPTRRMCAANNKLPERKHSSYFSSFFLSLDICQAKQIEFAARSSRRSM